MGTGGSNPPPSANFFPIRRSRVGFFISARRGHSSGSEIKNPKAAKQPVGNKFKPPLLGITEGNPVQSGNESENDGFSTLKLNFNWKSCPAGFTRAGQK